MDEAFADSQKSANRSFWNSSSELEGYHGTIAILQGTVVEVLQQNAMLRKNVVELAMEGVFTDLFLKHPAHPFRSISRRPSRPGLVRGVRGNAASRMNNRSRADAKAGGMPPDRNGRIQRARFGKSNSQIICAPPLALIIAEVDPTVCNVWTLILDTCVA